MYADATNVTFSAATIPDLESLINSDLKYIDRWLKANKSQCRQNKVYGYQPEAETTVLKRLHYEYSYRRCPNKPKQSQ